MILRPFTSQVRSKVVDATFRKRQQQRYMKLKKVSVGMLVHMEGSSIAFHFVAEANGSRSIAAQLSAVTNVCPRVVTCSASIEEGFKTH